MRAYGRFLEIGKTDIYQNRLLGLAPFQNNLSYFAIDLDRMLRERPQWCGRCSWRSWSSSGRAAISRCR